MGTSTFNAKSQFLSQVSSTLLIDLGCNVTLPLEDMGRVPQHIRGKIAGCWMRGKVSEKLPVSLRLISKQYVDGWMDYVLLARLKAVRELEDPG